jgi:undecaprenyl-diphosphatase
MSLENILAWDARFTAGLRVAEKPGPLRILAAVLAHSGDSWFWLLGLILVWWQARPFWQVRALALGAGVVVTALLVMSLKFTIRRRRPEGEWGNIYRKTDPHSFPSGHAARAAMLATINLGMGPPWLALFLVIWAPLVGLARVAMGVHYLSDVIAGAVLGVVVGSAVLVFT